MNSSEKNKNHSISSLFKKATKKKINLHKGKLTETKESQMEDYENVAAWFLGSKAENASVFQKFIGNSISEHAKYRKTFYKENDPSYITPDIISSDSYNNSINKMTEVQKDLLDRLKGSAPFFSLRYQGHMNWDTVMPGDIGYFTAMLYNQNNVASEGGPATCQLEKEVGTQMCDLIGYKKFPWNDPELDCKYGSIVPWAHITADGTIANIESMWAARNLKFYPLAIFNAINAYSCSKLRNAYDNLKITLTLNNNCTSTTKNFMDCTTWELLNLSCDTILSLSLKINDLCNLDEGELSETLAPYLLQNIGLLNYAKDYPSFTNIRIFVPATKHYSWPKSGTLLGLGQDSIIGIPVDDTCHMDTKALDSELQQCLDNHIIVLMVVAVIGSTEEGVIDNLEEILNLRKQYESKGLNFLIHCDAAWGGYLRTMMISPDKGEDSLLYDESGFVPSLPLSDYSQTQYNCLSKADTVTIDPHKAGFIPYPAGSLSYRNKLLRELITFNAAYIHSAEDLNLGIYGIEGSKPGAAAAAVWMAHNTIPLNVDGYGQILGECSFTNKLYYCYWLTLSDDKYKLGPDANKYDFCIEPLIPLPSEITLNSGIVLKTKEAMLKFIRTFIKNKPNSEIAENPDAIAFLRQIGSDVLINSFIVNFSVNGTWNTSLDRLNKFNNLLFTKFSVTTPDEAEKNEVDFIITSSVLDKDNYKVPLKRICTNLGFDNNNIDNMTFLINTTLQPWPTTHGFINTIMECFLVGIKDCIDKIQSEENASCLSQKENKPADLVEKIPCDSSSNPSRYLYLNNSYAGYANANNSNGNSLFYWFFESQLPCNDETPIIIWLNGGPGASSLAGLFLENGPLKIKDDLTIVPNENSWNKRSHMLFWDQPVGTGFSTNGPQNYVKTEEEMAYEFVNALEGFYCKHPEYMSCPLYITGESYAGKYIPYIATEIHLRNNSNINLKGIAIGDGWMEPSIQTKDQIDYSYYLGLIDTNQRKEVLNEYNLFLDCLNTGDMSNAFTSGNKVSDMLVNCGGGVNIYDARTWSDASLTPLKTYLSSPLLKKAIHVPECVNWAFADASGPVSDALINDLMAPCINLFDNLVSLTDNEDNPLYKVLFYTGNFDISCGFSGTETIVRNINWYGKDEWSDLQRLVWYKQINSQVKQTQGCIKSLYNLTQIEIPMSGHQVPLYQPEISLNMIYNWIFDEEFSTYNPLETEV